ncbi:endo-1,4-beta-xylanase [Paenibacillus sp. 453mf]|uniref:endo-1,4-beta-xylanase n=1 Tax=Paenibacillus sp. 453mf TaxID=1761874 RepID=UPI000B84DE3C|nr:endo-1,4-beta-xylanase [Paenibacillus sp. 453mf]
MGSSSQAFSRTVVEHFGNRVVSWDVVNEAMSDNPQNPVDWENALRKWLWYNAIGPDFVDSKTIIRADLIINGSLLPSAIKTCALRGLP